MGVSLLEIVNLVAVVLLVFFFNSFLLYSLHATKKKSCHEALYERSHHLLVLANLSNFIQSIVNILFGVIFFEHSVSSVSFLMTFYTLGTFFSRFYAMSMGLRVFRIKSLHSMRNGQLQCKFRNVFKLKYNLIIVLSYSFLFTGIYFVVYFYDNPQLAKSEMIQIMYLIESTVLFFSSFIVSKRAKHPTIALEYVFYSLIWLTGSVPNNKNRSFYIIPIRNSLLLLISSLSLFAHNNLIRPSFPSMIEFSNLFEIQEIFEDFSLFVGINGDPKENEALKIYFYIKVQQFTGDERMIGDIIKQCIECRDLVNLKNEHLLLDICTIEDCAKEILRSISKSYMNSDIFRRMKRDYFIIYN